MWLLGEKSNTLLTIAYVNQLSFWWLKFVLVCYQVVYGQTSKLMVAFECAVKINAAM